MRRLRVVLNPGLDLGHPGEHLGVALVAQLGGREQLELVLVLGRRRSEACHPDQCVPSHKVDTFLHVEM